MVRVRIGPCIALVVGVLRVVGPVLWLWCRRGCGRPCMSCGRLGTIRLWPSRCVTSRLRVDPFHSGGSDDASCVNGEAKRWALPTPRRGSFHHLVVLRGCASVPSGWPMCPLHWAQAATRWAGLFPVIAWPMVWWTQVAMVEQMPGMRIWQRCPSRSSTAVRTRSQARDRSRSRLGIGVDGVVRWEVAAWVAAVVVVGSEASSSGGHGPGVGQVRVLGRVLTARRRVVCG